jgi:acetyl esterase/lipase
VFLAAEGPWHLHKDLVFGTPLDLSQNHLTHQELIVQGLDNNPIRVCIYRPTNFGEISQLPVICYFHGGGMAINDIDIYDGFFRRLATYGVVVVGPNFRNSTVARCPAGISDCLAVVEYLHREKTALGLSGRLILAGESGGGNLAAATCLRAKRLGLSHLIDGQFLNCPYLICEYTTGTGGSMDKYMNLMMDLNTLKMLAELYTDPAHPQHRSDVEAWPGLATVEQLAGLPRAFVLVDECDPLSDSGVEYGRKLMAAGVPTTSLTQHGTVHGSCVVSPELGPQSSKLACWLMVSFARGEI